MKINDFFGDTWKTQKFFTTVIYLNLPHLSFMEFGHRSEKQKTNKKQQQENKKTTPGVLA